MNAFRERKILQFTENTSSFFVGTNIEM